MLCVSRCGHLYYRFAARRFDGVSLETNHYLDVGAATNHPVLVVTSIRANNSGPDGMKMKVYRAEEDELDDYLCAR